MEQSQLQAVWEQILNNMRDQLAASAFKWLDPVKPLSLTDSELVLGTQTGMAKDWITSHYLTILEDAVDAVLNGSRKITMKVVESPAPKEESQTVVSVVPAQRAHKEPENPGNERRKRRGGGTAPPGGKACRRCPFPCGAGRTALLTGRR